MHSMEKVSNLGVAFFNSGVIAPSLYNEGLSTFKLGDLVAPGDRRISESVWEMRPNSLFLPPHCHPGGEIARVLDGEYFDADINGNPIQTYPKGSVVVYGIFSTHRPLSQKGAQISYTTLNGILFPSNAREIEADSANELMEKMTTADAPREALIYFRKFILGE